jgi:hypothetical protein
LGENLFINYFPNTFIFCPSVFTGIMFA